MKKFKFTLLTFLKTKQIQESQTKKKLAEIMRQWAAAKNLADQLEKDIQDMQQQWLMILAEGTDSNSLTQYVYCMEALSRQLIHQKLMIEKIEKELALCQDELKKIMGEIKGLQKLEEKQYEEFLYESQKEQEAEIEEFVLFQMKTPNKHS